MNSLPTRMRTPLVLAVLIALALGDDIIEKSDTAEEVFQLRNKRCSKFNCEENEDMSNSLRHVFLAAHNGMRESLAQGTEVGKKGLLPKAANMYKLNWSCDLEIKARDWTRKCEKQGAAQGQNYVIIEGAATSDLPNTVVKKIGEWRRQVLTAEMGDEIKYTIAANIQQWANMANAETTEVGCSVHKCGSNLAVSCFYNKAGDVPDKRIYAQGTPCTFDYDCTANENSYCVPITGLCHLHAKKSSGEEDPETSTKICSNAKMTDKARHTVLDWHNALRSNLAFGKEEDGEGAYAPMASGMLKMHYDCVLEASAQIAVDRCTFAPYKRVGENIYITAQESTRNDQNTILQQATKQWWDELKQGGLGYNNTFTRKDLVNHLEHFTQMAWAATYRVGCATNVCAGKNLAVCHYSPSGNQYGHKVYTYGSPCKERLDCDVGQSCAAEEGLCVVSLE